MTSTRAFPATLRAKTGTAFAFRAKTSAHPQRFRALAAPLFHSLADNGQHQSHEIRQPCLAAFHNTPARFSRLALLTAFFAFALGSMQGQGIGLPSFQVRAASSYLGVNLADIDTDRARELKLNELSGVEIVAVMEGSPAYRAGLRPGDVVLSYNGEKLLGRQQLARLVAETPPNRKVALVCWREGEKKQISVLTGSFENALDAGPPSPSRVMDVPSTVLLWRNMLLGIESEALNEQLAQSLGVKQGILIWNVNSGSLAQQAGLRAGDVLVDFCGHAIHSPREVGLTLQQLQTQSQKKPVSLGVIRDHKNISLSIALDAVER